MRPELINRFDAIVTFKALTKREVGKIFDNLLKELQDRLIHKGIHLVVTPALKKHIIAVGHELKKHIIAVGHDEKYGARPLRRALQDELEHPIADGILAGMFDKGTVLSASLEQGTVKLNVIKE